MMGGVEEIEVDVAHRERATLRVGDVFLKIDADQTRTDREIAAMALTPAPTPDIVWRKPPVLALAALPGKALGRLQEPSTAVYRMVLGKGNRQSGSAGGATSAQDGNAWASEIVAVGVAAGHRHGQGKRRTADEGARTGRERTVCRLEAKALDGAPTAHREVPLGVEAGDLGDSLQGGRADQSEGTADVLGVHNDLSQPGGGGPER